MPKTRMIERVGLQNYLNMTANMHNGNTYDDFVGLLDRQPRPTDNEIAKEFSVTSMTIGNWRRIFDEHGGEPMGRIENV